MVENKIDSGDRLKERIQVLWNCEVKWLHMGIEWMKLKWWFQKN